jgi:hypothetical protein
LKKYLSVVAKSTARIKITVATIKKSLLQPTISKTKVSKGFDFNPILG